MMFLKWSVCWCSAKAASPANTSWGRTRAAGERPVDLELLHAGLALRLREKILPKGGDRAFLAGIGLPECGDDKVLVCVVGGCHDALLSIRRRFDFRSPAEAHHARVDDADA